MSFNDLLGELSDPESEDDTCTVPDDQVPVVLRPEARRKNADFDEFGYNPVIRDAAQGAEVDAYMTANWTEKQFERGIPELSRQGANNTAIVNWLHFQDIQVLRLLDLYRKRDFVALPQQEDEEWRGLLAWIKARPCTRMMAPEALQRYLAEERESERQQ